MLTTQGPVKKEINKGTFAVALNIYKFQKSLSSRPVETEVTLQTIKAASIASTSEEIVKILSAYFFNEENSKDTFHEVLKNNLNFRKSNGPVSITPSNLSIFPPTKNVDQPRSAHASPPPSPYQPKLT